MLCRAGQDDAGACGGAALRLPHRGDQRQRRAHGRHAASAHQRRGADAVRRRHGATQLRHHRRDRWCHRCSSALPVVQGMSAGPAETMSMETSACEHCWVGSATHCRLYRMYMYRITTEDKSDVGLCAMVAGGTEGRGAIEALLKLVQAGSGKGGGGGGSAVEEAEEPGAEHAAEGKQGKKRKKGSQPLCRPLIAVCNDLYAPALRPLRAVAKIVHYRMPTACSLIRSSTLLCHFKRSPLLYDAAG